MDEQPDKQDKKTKDRSELSVYQPRASGRARKAFYDEERKGAAPVTRAAIH
ncbi:hypothetical protein [Piscinibacter sp.]|uniref:hypothetical protein n=1 Tax=Piscinibacter sp. TaxID=1903157 RepID=UPI001D6F7ABA|nr:hypothetical protein [Piscinibacter sp.]MBK7532023.1 hypothetical protein [Piscinibacter sp.]